jgi:hypothetical protein
MNSVCGLFDGAKKSDQKSNSILEMGNSVRSGGIGKSKMIYAHLYQNPWVSVNHY